MAQILAASERQISFIRDMAAEVLGSSTSGDEFIKNLEAQGGLATRALTSAVIDDLLTRRAQARAERKVSRRPAAPAVEIDDGIYVMPDGAHVKVVHAVHGSGKQYAKKIVPPAYPGDKTKFVYTPGLIRDITPAMKITEEQAAAFGELYSCCVNCGRTLTREDSIERSMGPVCWGRLFGE